MVTLLHADDVLVVDVVRFFSPAHQLHGRLSATFAKQAGGLEEHVIGGRSLGALLVPLIQLAQLDAQDRRLQRVQATVPPDLFVIVAALAPVVA